MNAWVYKRLKLISIMGIMLAVSSIWTPTHGAVMHEDMLISIAKAASEKDDLLGIQALEPDALAAARGNANRNGDRLTLRLRSGSKKVYFDKPECKIAELESKCRMYRLVAYARSRGTFILAKLYYESAEYVLVDDISGDEVVLRAFPTFSPTGAHALVLLMNDEQLGFAIQIWRRAGRQFVLDWSESPYIDGMYTTYKLIRWHQENVIELRSETQSGPKIPSVTKYFNLRHEPDGWRVVPLEQHQ